MNTASGLQAPCGAGSADGGGSRRAVDGPGARRGRGAAGKCGLAGFLALALGGCDLDWNKPVLNVVEPKTFTESHSGPAAPVSDRWAASFGSAELTALVDRALAENLDIGVAVARIAQADAQARVSGAALFPQINLSGDTSRTKTPGTASAASGPFTESRRWSHSLGLTASYELDFWGKNAATLDAMRVTAVVSRYDRDVVALSTVGSLVNSYIALVGAQERLRILRDNVRIAEDVLGAVRQRLAVGTATSLDVAQQESVAATLRANGPSYEQTAQQTRNLIAVLVGATPETFRLQGAGLMKLRMPAVRPGTPSQLLLRRPDVAEAEASLAASELNVQAARAAFFPSISLTGQMGLSSMLLKNLFRPEAIAYSLAGQLAQPVLDGHALQGQYELRKAQYAELLLTYRKQVLTAFSDVEIALGAVRFTNERERLLALAVDASRRAYTAARQRLNEGTIDIVTLSTVQTNLFTSLDSLAQARQARLQALVSLYQALGGGWSDSDAARARGEEIRAFNDVKSPLP